MRTYVIKYRFGYRTKIFTFEIPGCSNSLEAIQTFKECMTYNRKRVREIVSIELKK